MSKPIFTHYDLKLVEPSFDYSLERRHITEIEAKILKKTAVNQVLQASDLKELFAGKANSEISRQIKKLIDKKMLLPEKEGARKYILRFDNNYLFRSIIKSLDDKGFLPIRGEI